MKFLVKNLPEYHENQSVVLLNIPGYFNTLYSETSLQGEPCYLYISHELGEHIIFIGTKMDCEKHIVKISMCQDDDLYIIDSNPPPDDEHYTDDFIPY